MRCASSWVNITRANMVAGVGLQVGVGRPELLQIIEVDLCSAVFGGEIDDPRGRAAFQQVEQFMGE